MNLLRSFGFNRSIKSRTFSSASSAHLNGWPGRFRLGINSIIRQIGEDANMQQIAKQKYIDSQNWTRYIAVFRRELVKEPELTMDRDKLEQFCRMLDTTNLVSDRYEEMSSSTNKTQLEKIDNCKKFLFDIMISSAQQFLGESIASFQTLCTTSDLRSPPEWYPLARIMKRKIIYHGGPTNSGKTYQALQRLRSADPEKGGGMYCGPLRLLALEIYEQLNRQGVYTDLLTGQERREVPFSSHISCTVEMVNLHKSYDVAVVDEIQMIGDSHRGYAWTRVLLGLQAREIHVCGGMEALDVVKKLAASTGDDFEFAGYERLSKLEIQEESLRGDYAKIRPGDCIVAFSRADIFSIRRQIEKLTPHKCAIIYGQLPPETRSTQARLFNEPNTGYDVLVASDAIGMGLNLNIRRIIFHTTIKKGAPEGAKSSAYWIDPSSIKQIAGRAGRLSSQYSVGEVSAWQDADLAYIRAVMPRDVLQIKAAGLFPSVDQVALFSEQLDKVQSTELTADVTADDEHAASGSAKSALAADMSNNATVTVAATSPGQKKMEEKNFKLSFLLERFVELAQIDGNYFLCEHDSMIVVSNWLHTIPLSLTDRFVFANAPVNIKDAKSMTLLYQFASAYARGRPVALNVRLSRTPPKDVMDFGDLCDKHNAVDLYLWLSCRFPKYFVEREICIEQKIHAINMIEKSLNTFSFLQTFSHHSDYQKLRKVIVSKSGGLPPVEFGEVRQITSEHMDKIPKEHHYVFPHVEEEEEEGGSSNRYRRSNGNHKNNSRFQKDARQHSRQDGKRFENNMKPNTDKQRQHNTHMKNQDSKDGQTKQSTTPARVPVITDLGPLEVIKAHAIAEP